MGKYLLILIFLLTNAFAGFKPGEEVHIISSLEGLPGFYKKKSGDFGIKSMNPKVIKKGRKFKVVHPNLHKRKGYTLLADHGTGEFLFVSDKWLDKGAVINSDSLDINKAVEEVNKTLSGPTVDCVTVDRNDFNGNKINNSNACRILENMQSLNYVSSSDIVKMTACMDNIEARLKKKSTVNGKVDMDKFMEAMYRELSEKEQVMAGMMYTAHGETYSDHRWEDQFLIMKVIQNRLDSSEHLGQLINEIDIALAPNQFSMWNGDGLAFRRVLRMNNAQKEKLAKAFIAANNDVQIDTDPPGLQNKISNYYSTCMYQYRHIGNNPDNPRTKYGCAGKQVFGDKVYNVRKGGPSWAPGMTKIHTIRIDGHFKPIEEPEVKRLRYEGREPGNTHIFLASPNKYVLKEFTKWRQELIIEQQKARNGGRQ